MNAINGTLSILNVGAGDVVVSFDPANPKERKRAARIVTDMMRQGFAILVKVGEQDGEPLYQRAKGFDPERAEYIVVGGPEEGLEIGKQLTGERAAEVEGAAPKRAKKTEKRVPVESTHAVSVARSAGG